jgi:hypothetical protein
MHTEGLVAKADRAEDKLGNTISFIRAAEEKNLKRMAQCTRIYPELANYIHADDPNARIKPAMEKLRDHAKQLAHDSLACEMSALGKAGLDPNSTAYQQKKNHILPRLNKLQPGEATTRSKTTMVK